MAITNYTELQAAILDWSHRSDQSARVPQFIDLAERRLTTILKARLQNAVATVETVAGTRSVTAPPSLAGIKALYIEDVAPSIVYLSPSQFAQDYSGKHSGAPRHYTLIGDLMYFGPIPDAGYTVTCVLNTSVPSLSAANPTNDVLTKWPNAYLYASLAELADFIENDAAKAKWEARLQEAIAGINLLDWHAGDMPRMRTDVRM